MQQLINDWDAVLNSWKSDCGMIYSTGNNINLAAASPANTPIDLSSFASQLEIDPAKAKSTDLLYYEIPEPYSCQYDNNGKVSCNAVLINLNPGTSSPTEYLKYYFNAGKPGMTLINDFLKLDYSDWQVKFNYLNPTQAGIMSLNNNGLSVSAIPGYDWWKDSNRIPFLKRLLMCQMMCQNGQQAEIKPFIIEMCPFHSQKWAGGFNSSVYNKQFELAYKAVCVSRKNRGLKFAVGIGKEISTFLNNNGAKCILSIDQNTVNNNNYQINPNNWPTTKGSAKKNRTYEVYKIHMSQICSSLPSADLIILVTYYRGGNHAPDNSFYNIEQDIIKYLRNNHYI